MDKYFASTKKMMQYFKHNYTVMKSRTPAFAEYLRRRNITERDERIWSIGYIPARIDDAFIRHTMRVLNMRQEIFGDRLVFPVRDKEGKILGFIARTWRDGDEREHSMKYAIQPANEYFQKSNALFGEYITYRSLRKNSNRPVWIVEGVFDAIAVAKKHPVVALMGSKMSIEQMIRLLGLHARFVLALDGDMAGVDGMLKMVSMFGIWQNLSFALLDEGTDIGEQGVENVYVTDDAVEFLIHTVPFVFHVDEDFITPVETEYYVNLLLKKYNLPPLKPNAGVK